MTEEGNGVLTTELREVFDMFGWKKELLPDPWEDDLPNSFVVEHDGRIVRFDNRCAGGKQSASYIQWSLDPNDDTDAELRFLRLLKEGCLAYTKSDTGEGHVSEWHIPMFETTGELRMKLSLDGFEKVDEIRSNLETSGND